MARQIKTVSSSSVGVIVAAILNDGSVYSEHFHVGDIIEDLKYVKNEAVETVSGRVTRIYYQLLSTFKKNNTNPAKRFNDIFGVTSIQIDCSTQYKSDVRTVYVRDIIGHNVNETDVERMVITPESILDLEVSLSDNTKTTVSVHEGDMLLGMKYISPTGDVSGNFNIENFVYGSISGASFKVEGLRLKNIDTEQIVIVPVLAVKSCGKTPVEVSTAEDFANEVANISGIAQINLAASITPETAVRVNEGANLILNLNGCSVIAPEAVNDRSIYAIDNYGTMKLTGGYIEARGIENFGTMEIEDTTIVARDANGGAGIWNEGEIIIGDGVEISTIFEGSPSDTSGPGCVNNRNDAKLTIKGGNYQSVNRRCYAICSRGDVVIDPDTNVTVVGAHGGLAIDAGTAVVNGGTYVSTEYYGLYVSNDGKKSEDGSPRVTVNGGDFKGKTYSVWVGSDVNNPVDCTVFIYGGIFRNGLVVQSNVAEGYGIKIFGGLFAEKPDDKFVAEGFYVTDEVNADGFYEIVRGEKPVNKPEPIEDDGEEIIDGDGPVDDDF